MNDSGVICRGQWQGEEVLGLRLNWEKAHHLRPGGDAARRGLQDLRPDHLLGDEEELGISLALIPTDTPGVEIGRRHLPLAAFMNGPNWARTFVPLEAIIGGRDMIGKAG